MTKIHHNTLKKATAHGITLEARGHGDKIDALLGDRLLAQAVDPKDALDLAIAALRDEQPKAPRKAKKARKVAKRRQDGEEGEEGEDEADASRSVVKAKYRARYMPNKGHCGDQLAKQLRDAFMTEKDEDTGKPRLDFEAFVAFAKANNVWVESYRRLKDRHGGRNDGLIRMNCANRLRAKVRRDKHKIVW